jgi:DNA polymerase-3 subunit alpha
VNEASAGRIRFGLSAIKGVGDAAARAILAERDTGGPFTDLRDLVVRVGMKGVNRRVLEHLIKTGAFDFQKLDRQHLLDSLDSVIAEAESLAKDHAAGQSSLFDLLEAPATASPTSGYQRAGAKMPKHELLKHERELLGFYISGHPMDQFGGLDEVVNSFGPQEDLKRWDREPFRLCGVANTIARKLTKKDNRPWAFFNLAGKRMNSQINVFPEAYEAHAEILQEAHLLCVEGEVRYDSTREEVRLNANRMYPLTEGISHLIERVTVICHPEESALIELARMLNKQLQATEGSTRIELGIIVEEVEKERDEAVAVGLTQGLKAQSNAATGLTTDEDEADEELLAQEVPGDTLEPAASSRYRCVRFPVADSLRCTLSPSFLKLLRAHRAVAGLQFASRPVDLPKPHWAKA